MTKEFYQILEIIETATAEDIKKSYRKLSLKYHPDRHNNKSLEEREQANKKMQEINRAYEVLGNEELRKRYDLGETEFTDYSEHEKYEEEIRADAKRREEELRRKEVQIIDLELEILKLEMKTLDRSSTLNEIAAALCFTLPRVYAEDLDPILWQPYQNWCEKVAKMEITIPKGKDRSEELKNFKEEMKKAIKDAEVVLEARKKDKKKNENDSELNQARTAAFGYIEKEMNEKGLKVDDLGQYSNYQERINSLGEVQEIRNFREEVLKFILKLAREGPKKEQGEREKKEAEERKQKEEELKRKRESFVAEITAILDQEPKLTNSELSPEYQNWEGQINQIIDIQQITNFQDRILADIQARRQDKKTAEEIKENLKKTQTGTKEEKEQAWENLDKNQGEQAYEDNKEEIKNAKKEKAKENPAEYREEFIRKVEKRMKEENLAIDEEIQAELDKLKNSQIEDPAKLVEAETEIMIKINQKEVSQKINKLTQQVKEALKSGKKDQITALKKELLEFISSGNIYYSPHKKAAQELIQQLESYSDNNDRHSSLTKPKDFSWEIVIPFLLIGVLSIAVVIAKKKKKSS